MVELAHLIMKKLFCVTLLAFVGNLFAQTDSPKTVPEKPDKNGWIKLFDGKTLSGWTAPDPSQWQ